MANLLSGLGAFGLGGLENMDIYEDEKKAEESVKKEVPKGPEEKDLIFEKSFKCPVCEQAFKNKTMRTGKTKLIGSDIDLRPKYEGIDVLKYDVIMCPHCGYAALTRYFTSITEGQSRMIMEKIGKAFKAQKASDSEIISYEEALERHKLTLANAVVKGAKGSEKGFICLKTAWILRGMKEQVDPKAKDAKATIKTLEDNEKAFLGSAFEGFVTARQTESYPMCGMDEITIDYLLSALAFEIGKYDISSKLVSAILVSPNANTRMKDRARDLKEMIVKEIRKA